jgi:hypothetical protein
MHNQLVVLTDDHIRIEEPFFMAKRDFFEWCLDQSWNHESNTFLHCGDLFHSNLPNPKEIDLAIDFFTRSKFKNIILMAGNGAHEFFRPKKTYAIDSLMHIDRVNLIKQPRMQMVGNLSMLLLPWVPNRFYEGIDNMKDYYENLPSEISDRTYDYIFGHFASKKFFDDEVNIDYLRGEKRMGHIHFPDETYLGASTITRKDEAGQKYQVTLIDINVKTEEKLPIPVFIDYFSVKYPDMPKTGNTIPMLEIFDAPSKAIAQQEYSEYHIHSIHLNETKNSTSDSGSSDKSSLSIKEHMQNFISEKGIDSTLANKLLTLINEVEE